MGFFDDDLLYDLFTAWADWRSPGMSDVAASRVRHEMFVRGVQPDRDDEVALARTRLMEELGAEASFPCGVVAVPEDARTVDPAPVTVLVTQDAFVFVREGIEALEEEPVVEVGRVARDAVSSVDVQDPEGAPLTSWGSDPIEPVTPCRVIVTWRDGDDAEDRDAFAFRAVSVAEEAAARFRRHLVA